MEQVCVMETPTQLTQEPIVVHVMSEVVPAVSPSLAEIQRMVATKISEDIIRFRTCCVDPRASK